MADGVRKVNENILKDGRVFTLTVDIEANKLEGGTQYLNPLTGVLKYVKITNTGIKTWSEYDPAIIFNPKTITTTLLADSCVTTDKVNDSAITTDKLKNLNVTTEKLADLSVTTEKINNEAVTTDKLADESVITDKIADYSVTNIKLANNSVDADKIKRGSIINDNIANGTIEHEKIKSRTLTSNEIDLKALTENVIADNAISTRTILDRAITSDKIGIGSIIRVLIANKAVNGDKIDDESISTKHIDSINAIKLEDYSITEKKYGDGSISNRAIANEAISIENFDASLKDLTDRAIRVEQSQDVDGVTMTKTAWCKGSFIIKHPNVPSSANLIVYGDADIKGTVSALKCYNPVFADLAEGYIPTEKFKSGDPVSLCLEGGLKIEKLNKENTDRFIGFVSDEYATVFGASEEELKSYRKVAVTLIGRIKIKANGEAKIGNYVSIENGEVIFKEYRTEKSIGRVLENKCKTDSYVLCQLWA